MIHDAEIYDLPWADDNLFFTYEWEDETSQFDPKGRWMGGSEYYSRTYRCRIPKLFENCQQLIDNFIYFMDGKDVPGFWLE